MAGSTIAATGMRSRGNCSRISMSWLPTLRGHGDFRMGEGEQLQSGRSCLRSHPADTLCRVAGCCHCRSLDGRDGRAGLCRNLPGAGVAPWRAGRRLSGRLRDAHRFIEQMSRWIDQLDRIGEREPSTFRTIEEASQRLSARNKRLTPALALHLARHGVRQDADGLYRWKFDHHLRARAPYRLSPDDYIGLWSRITCPTLLMWGDESYLPDPSRPARAFQASRTGEARGRRTLAAS